MFLNLLSIQSGIPFIYSFICFIYLTLVIRNDLFTLTSSVENFIASTPHYSLAENLVFLEFLGLNSLH